MAKSKVRGAARLRKVLKSLPDASREELGDTMKVISARLLGQAKAEVPIRTGRLKGLLSAKVLVKSLSLKLGLVTKRTQRQGFYGFILDQGRKAQTANAKRKNKVTGTVSTYALRVRAIPRERYNFIFGRIRDFRKNDLPKLREALERVLSRAARGGIDD